MGMAITAIITERTVVITTPVEKPSRSSRQGSGKAPIVIALLLAGALLYIGIPHLLAAWFSERAAATVTWTKQGKATTEQTLLQAVAFLQTALQWQKSRRYHFDIASLHYARSKKYEPDSAEARAVRNLAVAHQQKGLRLAPVEPTGWTQLGWYLFENNRTYEALAAVRQSTRLAAYAPEHMWWRLELWLILRSEFESGDWSLFRRQLSFAMEQNPRGLAGMAKHYGLRPYVRQLLYEIPTVDPRAVETFFR